ncbi:MAG: hypothetical protein BWY57_00505 [Betaproteobacteria bacterium ADurb.Bin341]|nr:MAG: hypothetical protein BWY57_00505 [Betaproteobacteria bacterium ADurb.Bin341]
MKYLLFCLLALCCLGSAVGAEVFGTVDALVGDAYVLDSSGESFPLTKGREIHEGESIGTRQDGEVHLLTMDGGLLALRPNTLFRVDAYKAGQTDDDRIYMTLLKGALRSITGWIGKVRKDAYQLKTPTATIGVRGTDHETLVLEHAVEGYEAGTYHRVTEGATVMRAEKEELHVKGGEAGFLSHSAGAVPRRLALVPKLFLERRLRLEHRVPERRDMLKGVIEQLPEKRAERMKQILHEAGRDRREAGQDRPEAGQDRPEAGQDRHEMRQDRREAGPEGREGVRRRVIRRTQQRR